jgi:hypothetical protein
MLTTDHWLVVAIILLVLVVVAQGFWFVRLQFRFWDLEHATRYRSFDGFAFRYEFYGDLVEVLRAAERETGVPLTWAARDVLMIPIIEQLMDGREVDMNQVRSSVRSILEAIREDHSGHLTSDRGSRNALAVIKGFFKRFCSIPPFCLPTEEPTSRGQR